MARVAILAEADSDLEEQAIYLSHEASLDIALRFYDAVQVSFDLLARNPQIGVQRDSKRLYGQRDLESILGPEGR